MADCLFCKIAHGETPSTMVYDDEEVYAFEDLYPVAPTHVLVIPKRHIDGLDAVSERDEAILGRLMLRVNKIARDLKLDGGYRVITNIGEDGGQTVRHLHFHIIGGAKLRARIAAVAADSPVSEEKA